MVLLHCDIIRLNYCNWARVSYYDLSGGDVYIWLFLFMEVQWNSATQQQSVTLQLIGF